MPKRYILHLLLLGGALALAILLFRPLSDRRWRIMSDTVLAKRKEEYLAAVESAARAAASARETAGGADAALVHRARTPNIILILADDLSRNDISIYGGPTKTPNIDRIGTDGVVFTAATCTTSICAPSRASLLTGRYQQRYGFELQPHDRYARSPLEYLVFKHLIDTGHMVPVWNSSIPRRRDIPDQGLPNTEITLAEVLGARGYRTAAYGKWHLGYAQEFSPLRFGFEEHYGFYEAFSLYAPVEDETIVDTPIDDFSDRHMWSRGRKKASAIVHNDQVVEETEYLTFKFADLAVSYIEAHAEGPDGHEETGAAGATGAAGGSVDGASRGGDAAAGTEAATTPFFLYLPFNAPHTPLQAPQEYVDRFPDEPDPVRRTYRAMIAALDDAVGEILAAVDRAGIAEDTLIVFASDNGGTSYLGVTDNGPLAGGKFTTFNGGLAVPLLMRYPRSIEPGSRVHAPVSLMDIYSTVEAATRPGDGPDATPEPERPNELAVDGVDLLPYVAGTAAGLPHNALYHRSIYNHAVRTERWKLLKFDPANPTGRGEVLLYDLSIDPHERNNVAADHPDVTAELTAMLTEWESDLADPLWPPVMHFWLDVWGRRYWFAV